MLPQAMQYQRSRVSTKNISIEEPWTFGALLSETKDSLGLVTQRGCVLIQDLPPLSWVRCLIDISWLYGESLQVCLSFFKNCHSSHSGSKLTKTAVLCPCRSLMWNKHLDRSFKASAAMEHARSLCFVFCALGQCEPAPDRISLAQNYSSMCACLDGGAMMAD